MYVDLRREARANRGGMNQTFTSARTLLALLRLSTALVRTATADWTSLTVALCVGTLEAGGRGGTRGCGGGNATDGDVQTVSARG